MAGTSDDFNTTAAAAAAAAAAEDFALFPTTTPLGTADAYDDFTDPVFRQQIIISKAVSLLSGMGSAYIIYSMVFDVNDSNHRKNKLHRSFDRLLLGLCVSDLIASMSLFLASWLIPSNPLVNESDDVVSAYWAVVFPQAVGNTVTCAAQGAFMYAGICASALFTGSIAISFLLQVRFQFSEKQMRLAEKMMFAVSTLFPLVGSICVLVDRGFNPSTAGFCFIRSGPLICEYDWGEDYCVDDLDARGERSLLYIIMFFGVPFAVVLPTIIACMGMLFWSVRTQELRSAKWSEAAASGRDQKRVFVKSMLFIGAFLVAWIPCIIGGALDLQIVLCVFAPLQGVLNVLIYSNFLNVFKEEVKERTASMRRSMSMAGSSTFDYARKSTKQFSMSTDTDLKTQKSFNQLCLPSDLETGRKPEAA